MIEKLDLLKMFNERQTDAQWNKSVETTVNLLIDAVNKQQQQLNNHMCRLLLLEHPDSPDEDDAIQEVIHTDPYEEQVNWIGKLCKFWDYDGEEKWFSILEHIDKNSPCPYCASGDWWYKHCEPVGIDDDFIYKKEQQ